MKRNIYNIKENIANQSNKEKKSQMKTYQGINLQLAEEETHLANKNKKGYIVIAYIRNSN